MEVRCNVIRFTKLGEPACVADGDYEKTLDDGTVVAATYLEYLQYIGLPEEYCQMEAARAVKP